MLLDLQADSVFQGELDLENDEQPDHSKLMTTLDGQNQRFGKGWTMSTILTAAKVIVVNQGDRADSKCRTGRGAAGLGDEAGAADAGLHDLLGRFGGGAGLKRLSFAFAPRIRNWSNPLCFHSDNES